VEARRRGGKRNVLARHAAVVHWRASRLPGNVRALLWAMTAGVLFVLLNAVMRSLAIALDPFETQFLRYLMGVLVMLPLIARGGFAAYRPRNIPGQFVRGAVHTVGLAIWFSAVPHITIADTTAIGFTTPLFIMLGAVLLFKETMRWERWLAAAIGFAGVMIVVAPKLSAQGGIYSLVMLSASPVFAASFLITKALTRYERAEVIVVWQSITVALLSIPMATLHWTAPSLVQWLLFLLCGLLGSSGHYCLTRSYATADISATQSVKFLDLVWATLLGWLVFGDTTNTSTLIGGVVICASTIWIARRETRGGR
jgi:drug/metabolite transporter (DMT)-like permease